MKKVLIIANLFHASPRIPGIAKYLSSFGWEPTILTVPIGEDLRYRLEFPDGFLEKVRVVETSYRGDIFWLWRKIFRKIGFDNRKSILYQVKDKFGDKSKKSFLDFIFNLYINFFAYPDGEKKWKKPALDVAEKILNKEKFDAIISSSSPVTAHIIANNLKKKYEQSSFGKEKKLPWIADLRDLWTQNHNYPYKWWRKIFERRLELKTLALADVLVTVSPPLVEKLKELHKKNSVYNITNGFFEEEINKGASLTKKFTITYAGAVYTGKQDPKDFFSAVKELISEKIINPDDVEIRFYTGKIPWLEKEIIDFGLENLVKTYDKISRSEIMKIQNESHLLLLIDWGDKEEKGWISLKIFGYLAALRPILVIGGEGGNIIEKTISETKSGYYAVTAGEIRNFLKNSYFEYKKKREVGYNGDLTEIKKYGYREKAKEFSEILNEIT